MQRVMKLTREMERDEGQIFKTSAIREGEKEIEAEGTTAPGPERDCAGMLEDQQGGHRVWDVPPSGGAGRIWSMGALRTVVRTLALT